MVIDRLGMGPLLEIGYFMSYDNQIRILENQLRQLESVEPKNMEQISKILNELRTLREAQYEESQLISFDDDR